jgi:hypothetical protein
MVEQLLQATTDSLTCGQSVITLMGREYAACRAAVDRIRGAIIRRS